MDEREDCVRDLSTEDVSRESEIRLRTHLTGFLKDRMSRRELLKAGGLTGLSISTFWALACQPAAPAPTKAPVAAAPTPITPAAATATKAPAATAAPAGTPTPEKIGKQLIGKLEGPEIITDPAKFPKTFKEAPALAELTKAGKLPAVKDRIGEDPLVVKPLKEIGKYGGMWRRGFSGPADFWNGCRAASGPDHILFYTYDGNASVPNIAKGWEVTDGGKTITIFLRKGMRWSDGQPFTSDDFKFWWEDVYNNKDLLPAGSADMLINFKPGTMEFPDKYTVRYKFPDPYYAFVKVLSGSTYVSGGHSLRGREATGGFAPAHYLKQFHPKYVAKEALDKIVKDAKFDTWVNYFKERNSWHLNKDMPTVTPWVTTTPANTPQWVQERNPYSIWVDTEGNQLPYIDKISYMLGENLEIINLRAIAGEYDFQARHMDISKIPVFLANQEKGNYKLYLDPGDYGGDMILKFNMSYVKDPEIQKWFNTTDFRRALSLGIERDQINEAFWMGIGTPGSVVPVETNPYHPGPEYRKLWATYDPAKANEMLDKIGLDKKDGAGYRLRSDGKGRLQVEVITQSAQVRPFTQICEMVREQWKKIGIDLFINEVERGLANTLQSANETQLFAWNNDGSEHPFTFATHILPNASPSSGGELIARWVMTGGKSGMEPKGKLREALDLWSGAFGQPDAEATQSLKKMWTVCADEVFIMGLIGMGPASMGTRVAKNNMGNVPSRQYCSPDAKTPSISRTVTFFYKS